MFHSHQLYGLTGGLLDLASERLDLMALLLIGGAHTQRQQMPSRIVRYMHLRSILALVSVIGRTWPARQFS